MISRYSTAKFSTSFDFNIAVAEIYLPITYVMRGNLTVAGSNNLLKSLGTSNILNKNTVHTKSGYIFHG